MEIGERREVLRRDALREVEGIGASQVDARERDRGGRGRRQGRQERDEFTEQTIAWGAHVHRSQLGTRLVASRGEDVDA